jgi:hypothetical protein
MANTWSSSSARASLGAPNCPHLPGVGVAGDSQEEVEELIREAITFHLDGLW